ncbi:hypothetical protein HDU87_003872 [Geranomyces variabilis]|uniref:AAA+ ATPase domain-containing protein n=1 Tax=Geranomyces variabilis TaxID=109894 RepID=A0AAD5TLL9_9FUNG|nr:hypothetical protein HDU87_003872 [Geranomyces variabilis]
MQSELLVLVVADILAADEPHTDFGFLILLPRNCTTDGGTKIRSGCALQLQPLSSAQSAKSHRLPTVTARVRLLVQPAAGAFAVQNDASDGADATRPLSCCISAQLAAALRCTRGNVVEAAGFIQPTAIPRAKSVHLCHEENDDTEGSKDAVDSCPSSASFNATLVRQAALTSYIAPASRLYAHPSFASSGAPAHYIVATIDGTADPAAVFLADHDTQFTLLASRPSPPPPRSRVPSAAAAAANALVVTDAEWAARVRKRVAGMDALVTQIASIVRRAVDDALGGSKGGGRNAGKLHRRSVCGAVLCGRPGVGKTVLARAMAGTSFHAASAGVCVEFFCVTRVKEGGDDESSIITADLEHSGLPYDYIQCPELLQFAKGDGELYLLHLLTKRRGRARIVILDQIDALVGAADAADGASGFKLTCFAGSAGWILNVLMECLDGEIGPGADGDDGVVIVIAITSRPHVLPNALLQSRRLSPTITADVGDARQREAILHLVCANLPIADGVIADVADATHGFVGADLEALVNAAAWGWRMNSSHREFVTSADFAAARAVVKPASFAELGSRIPRKRFGELFGVEDVVDRLRTAVLRPFANLDAYAALGVHPPRGVLIHGPAGVGKSVLSYALVREAGFNCVYVDGPKVRSKIVGESEQNIARMFAQARTNAPCILLLDQIDMLVPPRGTSSSSENTGDRIVASFLTEMDGVLASRGVFIVAISAHPECVDDAILRPGRLDEWVEVPMPGADARRKIWDGFLGRMPGGGRFEEAEMERLVAASAGYTGADIESVCREAALSRLRADLNSLEVTQADIWQALTCVRRSVVA